MNGKKARFFRKQAKFLSDLFESGNECGVGKVTSFRETYRKLKRNYYSNNLPYSSRR